jgi:glycosyltransferase involved in cell wall biosynthesis
MMLTIAYMTNRRNPRFEWFVDSLTRQSRGHEFELLVIDFYAGERDLAEYARSKGMDAKSHAPKPTVWQGPHRLTKADYFAASNARNTAICLARGDYIVFADDLSVLTPSWFSRVIRAASGGYVVCGAYEKALELVVEEGVIINKRHHPPGTDARLRHQPTFDPCPSNWFYGCSCGAPVEAFIKINGYPEICDGMGYEDAVTGDALKNSGHSLQYDPEMMTVESEEGHHEDKPFIRDDPGKSPNDKSHALLNICRGLARFDNYFGPAGIRGLRVLVQAGEPFPVVQIPEHEWFTGRRLRDL